MSDRLQVGITPRYVTSHPGQLSLLPSVGWEMITSQSALVHCGSGSKAGWLIPFMMSVCMAVKTDPSLIRAILSTSEVSIALITSSYTNVLS